MKVEVLWAVVDTKRERIPYPAIKHIHATKYMANIDRRLQRSPKNFDVRAVILKQMELFCNKVVPRKRSISKKTLMRIAQGITKFFGKEGKPLLKSLGIDVRSR